MNEERENNNNKNLLYKISTAFVYTKIEWQFSIRMCVITNS